MSYTFLLDAGEESSVESFSDIPASVLSRLNLTEGKSCSNANGTESCPSSQSGMTCEPLTEHLGEEKLTLCAEDSPVRTSAGHPTQKQDLPATEADCGQKWFGWFAKWDQGSCSWKIPQGSLFEDLDSVCVIWPKWGMMRSGECFPLPMLEHDTSVKGSGLRHPTPTKRDWKGASDGQRLDYSRWTTWLHHEFSHSTKSTYPNPDCSEAVMGFPIGWTALNPLATDKFQQWLNSHGKPSQTHEKTRI